MLRALTWLRRCRTSDSASKPTGSTVSSHTGTRSKDGNDRRIRPGEGARSGERFPLATDTWQTTAMAAEVGITAYGEIVGPASLLLFATPAPVAQLDRVLGFEPYGRCDDLFIQ